MKKFLCITLCAALVIGIALMTGWTTGDVWTPEAYDETAKSNYSKQDEVIASSSKYELVWKGSDCTVDLVEKGTENRWGVTNRNEDEPAIDPILGIAKKVPPELSSAIVLDVLDMKNNQTSSTFSATSAVRDGAVVTEKISNGIRVTTISRTCR